MSQHPVLQPTAGHGYQLLVDGKPFLMLAGELQNSSMTSAAFMEEVWSDLVESNFNTVLGSVTWESIEPEEGVFDFSQLDLVIEGARRHGLKLVLLWFGSFKNALSTYAPPWVKKDNQRFPRARLRSNGGARKVADAISIFHPEARDLDAKAFAALMAHLQTFDEQHSTVIMVQVENEVGLLGDSRDVSACANRVFEEPVPQEFLEVLHDKWDVLHPKLLQTLKEQHDMLKALPAEAGSWEKVFGPGPKTDELFMAYHFAKYVEHVAAAGRAVNPLPLYTNVWQNYSDEDNDNPFPTVVGGGGFPGDYPSGGSVLDVLDIWMDFAPSLDFVAPDIYLNDYSRSCAAYHHRGQALFIPEQRRDEYGARRVWNAFGSHQTLGCSPFGVDTLRPQDNPFKKHYGLLKQVSAYILQAQSEPGKSVGFFFDEPPQASEADRTPPVVATLGGWELTISRSFVFGQQSPGFGMIFLLANDTFLLVGEGFQVSCRSTTATSVFTGILSFVEKEVIDVEKGELRTVRQFNGDETRSGLLILMPSEEPDYGDFPISVTIPARTKIAECQFYSLNDEEAGSVICNGILK